MPAPNRVLDTPPEAEFDAFTWLAAHVCSTPVAVISLVGSTRLWFTSKIGFDLPETTRAASLLVQALEGQELFEVPDTLADDRFRNSPMVASDPQVRFYAAAPLVSPNGSRLGNLCVMDLVPRRLLPDQREALTRLAQQVTRQLESHAVALEQEQVRLDRSQLITERDQAHSLHESVERYRLMVSSIKDYAIFMLDTGGHIATWNAGAERIKGYRAEEIIGRHFSVFYPQQDIERDKPGMELDVATTEGRCEDEGWRLRKDGSRFFAHVVITAMRDEAGVLKGFAKVTRDVTEKKQADQALRESEAQFRALAENIADVFWMISPDLQRVFYVNPAYERIWGHSAESLYSNPRQWTEAIPAQERERVITEFSRLANGEALATIEFPILRPDGTSRWLVTRGVPVHDSRGEVVQLAGTTQDITEHRRAEQALRESEQLVRELNGVLVQRVEEAELANRAKTTFLATMSHELRTPIHGMFGMLELLSRTQLDASQQATLATIRESGAALLWVIDDILEFSRIEAGELEVVPEAVSIPEIVDSVFHMFHGNAISKNLVLKHTVDPRISAALMVDPRRLRQIFGKFVANALRFTSSGGVTIEAKWIDRLDGIERIQLVVQDTGIGIAEHDLKRLLMPLGQVQGMGRISGTGLGLTISRRLAELIGASVDISSTPGVGTRISLLLSLPIADAGQPRHTHRGASPLPATAAPPRAMPDVKQAEQEGMLLLLVDDHPLSRMLLVRQVNLLGYCAETAEDGASALHKWKSGRFGLIITDCDMPNMDGYELTRVIRQIEAAQNLKRTPIVACTASALAEEAGICLSAGMDDFLAKPTTLSAIASKLDQWLPLPIESSAPTELAGQSSRPAQTPVPVDPSVMAATWGSDAAVLRYALAEFRRANDRDAADLRQAVAQGDLAQVAHVAHRMHGASRTIGAQDFADACRHIDQASRAGERQTVNEGMHAFEREFVRLGAYIDSY